MASNAFSDSGKRGRMTEGLSVMLSSAVERVACTSLGQSMLKLVDRFLWVVEKSAEWSLPSEEIALDERNGKSFGGAELIRPLPWILFLPGLVLLRLSRACANVGAYVFGYPPVQPRSVVKCLQRTRRRLRAVKTNGMKSLRQRKEKRLSVNEVKRALIGSIRLTLSSLSCLDGASTSPSPPPTKIRVSRIDPEATRTPEEKSTTESAGSPMHGVEAKRKFSELSSDEGSEEEEPLQCKIDRLALEDSADDADYNPADKSTSGESSGSGSGTGSGTGTGTGSELGVGEEEDGAAGDVSLSEVADIVEDARDMIEAVANKTMNAAEKRVDKEEEEPVRGVQAPATGFYSPDKLSQDADAAFYSPMGSQSASPDRSPSPFFPIVATSKDQDEVTRRLPTDLDNADYGASSASAELAARLSAEEASSSGLVCEKRGKAHHRGKRANHGNRKKT